MDKLTYIILDRYYNTWDIYTNKELAIEEFNRLKNEVKCKGIRLYVIKEVEEDGNEFV